LTNVQSKKQIKHRRVIYASNRGPPYQGKEGIYVVREEIDILYRSRRLRPAEGIFIDE
jgi:hypothetical protein